MANTLRLRRGSTAPSAGSFVEGEPAWDSTNGRLYVKNAAGSMVKINNITTSTASEALEFLFNRINFKRSMSVMVKNAISNHFRTLFF